MNDMIKKTVIWIVLTLTLASMLIMSPQRAVAQTDPNVTPQEGYPPPATPSQPDTAYPSETLAAPTIPSFTDEGYIAPTDVAVAPTDATVVGSGTVETTLTEAETAVNNIPISQTEVLRNRAILWAGFLITLLIFFIAVYGAMLMYTRRRR